VLFEGVSMRPAIILLVMTSAFAQAKAPPAEKTEAARAIEAAADAKKAAEAYKVTTGATGGQALHLEPKSLLHWSNPVIGSFHGSVFIWTAQGRPEVVASIYKKFVPLPLHLGIEFQSLTEGSATAERHGHADWAPVGGGVKFQPVPGAPTPADTPARRLGQMRAIAAEFSATKKDRKAVSRPLRLLTQPVYRYERSDPGGALFGFVEGTDPEVFLLIEARTRDKAPTWHYALARMNSVEFHVAHRGREVWSVPLLPWTQARNPREPYTLLIFRPGQGVNLPEPSSERSGTGSSSGQH
jgi:hypothetical protein